MPSVLRINLHNLTAMKNIIREAVEEIRREADELKAKQRTEYEDGQLLGLASALDIIKSACLGYDLEELGLDFDVDKTYLVE